MRQREESQARIHEQFGQTMGSIQQPLLTFRTQLTQINQFERFKLLEGDRTARGLMGYQALQGLMGAVGLPEVRFSGAMERGGREAYSTVIQNQQSRQRQPVQEQIRGLLEAAKEQQREQIRIGEETLQAIRDLGLPDPREIK